MAGFKWLSCHIMLICAVHACLPPRFTDDKYEETFCFVRDGETSDRCYPLYEPIRAIDLKTGKRLGGPHPMRKMQIDIIWGPGHVIYIPTAPGSRSWLQIVKSGRSDDRWTSTHPSSYALSHREINEALLDAFYMPETKTYINGIEACNDNLEFVTGDVSQVDWSMIDIKPPPDPMTLDTIYAEGMRAVAEASRSVVESVRKARTKAEEGKGPPAKQSYLDLLTDDYNVQRLRGKPRVHPRSISRLKEKMGYP